MTSLVLNSLEIRNFRAFRHLRIARLGRVNLIVGKNNVGKSSLLEALWVYARRGEPATVWDMLETRDESHPRRSRDRVSLTVEERLSAIRFLFYGRRDVRDQPLRIQIGPADSPSELVLLDIEWGTSYRARPNGG